MSGVALAVGLAGVAAGAITSSDASRRAAHTQADAAQQAQDTTWDMYNQNRQDLMPWATGGAQANEQLMRLLGLGGGGFDPNALLVRPFGESDFTADPGYKFRLQQGQNALLAKMSAGGGLAGGNTMRALADYQQGLASQEYGNAFNRYQQNQQNVYNRLSGLSNSGLNAAGDTAGLGANAAGNAAGLQYAQGQANAGGILGGANALNNGLGNLAQQWLYARNMQNQQPQPYYDDPYASGGYGT